MSRRHAMDMQPSTQDQLVFHLTGRRRRRRACGRSPACDLRPALLAPLPRPGRAAPRLPAGAGRRAPARPTFVHTLVGPGRRRAARTWRRAASKANACAATCCSSSARSAARSPPAPSGTPVRTVGRGRRGALGAREGETLEQVLRHAGGALRADGAVLGCTPRHAGAAAHARLAAVQRDKARAVPRRRRPPGAQLSDILRAAFSHSQAGRSRRA